MQNRATRDPVWPGPDGPTYAEPLEGCLGRSRSGHFRQLGKGRRIRERQLGEAFSIEFHARLAKSAHETAIGESVLSGGRIDPHDPKAAKISLAELSSAVGVTAGSIDGFLCHRGQFAAPATKPFGALEKPIFSLVRGYAALYP